MEIVFYKRNGKKPFLFINNFVDNSHLRVYNYKIKMYFYRRKSGEDRDDM